MARCLGVWVAAKKIQLQRSCAIQSKVGALVAVRKHLPWVNVQNENNLNEVVAAHKVGDGLATTALRLMISQTITQGSRVAATLGFGTESRWDSQTENRTIETNLGTENGFGYLTV